MSNNIDINVNMQNENIDISIQPINIQTDVQNFISTRHDFASNRDLPNQHPMLAITGLQNKLEEVESESLTNIEILNILNI